MTDPLQLMAGVCVVVGAGYYSRKREVTPLVFFLVAGAMLLMASSERAIFRIAVAGGWAKVGCFTYEAKECKEMIGQSSANAPSMYKPAPPRNTTQHSKWYAINNQLNPMPLIYRIPGAAFLSSPTWITSSKKMRELIYRQRNELVIRRSIIKSPDPVASTYPEENETIKAQSFLLETLHSSEKRIAAWRNHMAKQQNLINQTLWNAQHPNSNNTQQANTEILLP